MMILYNIYNKLCLLLVTHVFLLFFSAPKRPPAFISGLKPLYGVIGETSSFMYMVSGSPEPAVRWFRNEKPLEIAGRVASQFDGRNGYLTISDADIGDTGEYRCEVTNENGSASSRAELVIAKKSSKPKVERPMEDVSLYEGEEARFEVRFSGNPQPNIKWYKETTKIIHGQGGGRYNLSQDGNTYTLKIKDARVDDLGLYRCVASNDMGKVTSKAELDVKDIKYPPEFLGDEPGPIEAFDGSDTSMRVTVRGNPKPSVTWYKNGDILHDSRRVDLRSRGDSSHVTIYGNKSDDTGVYKVEASNRLGKATRIFDLRVKGIVFKLKRLCI